MLKLGLAVVATFGGVFLAADHFDPMYERPLWQTAGEQVTASATWLVTAPPNTCDHPHMDQQTCDTIHAINANPYDPRTVTRSMDLYGAIAREIHRDK